MTITTPSSLLRSERTPRPTALYRVFDETDTLLYIGISNSVLRRLAQHMQGKGWSKRVKRVEVEHYEERTLAAKAEEAAILAESPLFNIALNVKKARDVEVPPPIRLRRSDINGDRRFVDFECFADEIDFRVYRDNDLPPRSVCAHRFWGGTLGLKDFLSAIAGPKRLYVNLGSALGTQEAYDYLLEASMESTSPCEHEQPVCWGGVGTAERKIMGEILRSDLRRYSSLIDVAKDICEKHNLGFYYSALAELLDD